MNSEFTFRLRAELFKACLLEHSPRVLNCLCLCHYNDIPDDL